MSALRALVVDDEPHARDELVYALKSAGGDLSIEEADNALDALALINEKGYDVVFLDVNLPKLSGIEAMRVLAKAPQRPEIVVVTAHDAHAVTAFEFAAADYLLKPVSAVRVQAALERVRARRRAPAAEAPVVNRFAVERDGRTLLLRPGEIRFVEASGHEVTAHTFDATAQARGSLAECADRLAPHGFMRVHRAYLVNPEHVVEVRPFFNGTYVLIVDDRAHSEVPVSRAYAKQVRAAFQV